MAGTIAQLLDQTAARLRRAGLQDSEREARWLLQDCLGLGRSELILRAGQQVAPEMATRLASWIERRCRREPLAYISGCCQFWSRTFHVTPDVLVPRPETELLVEQVLGVLQQNRQEPMSILDLCCGSGVIGITLALEIPDSVVVAADLSWPALEVARRNIQRHGPGAVHLVRTDLFQGFVPAEQFSCIVSNPPYVRTATIRTLQPEVRKWEPRQALDGGIDGMEYIRCIGREAGRYLRPSGFLFLEIGSDQGVACETFFSSLPEFTAVRILRDLAGHPRMVQARKRRGTWTR